MALRIALVWLAATLLSGCWPARFTERPGLVGTVVAADTHQPIAGAHIKLNMPVARENPWQSVTSRTGTFKISPRYGWGIYTLLGDTFPVRGSIDVEAAGFAPARREITWPPTAPARQDVGVITLSRYSGPP